MWPLQYGAIVRCRLALLRNPLIQGSAELSFNGLPGSVGEVDTRHDRSKETSHSANERGKCCGDGNVFAARSSESDNQSNRLNEKQDRKYDICNTLAYHPL